MLQHLVAMGTVKHCTPAAVAAMLAEAPALQELDLSQLMRQLGSEELQAMQQLLAREQALRCLRLRCTPGAEELAELILQPAAQRGLLQHLVLAQGVYEQEYPLLSAVTSLRALELASSEMAVLRHLPAQLTALTFMFSGTPAWMQPAPQGSQPLAPGSPLPLGRLVVSGDECSDVLRLLSVCDQSWSSWLARWRGRCLTAW
jgi:hypothetical protein